MASTDILIVGGGFAGIYTAWRLAQDGLRVSLIEASDHLGGTLWSRDWNGFLVDAGTHNFDLRSPVSARFYEDILGDDLGETDSNEYASTTGRVLTRGFEMPDLSADHPDLCRRALDELSDMQGAPGSTPPDDLASWLLTRYGSHLGQVLCGFAEKVIGAPIDGIAAEAQASLGMLSRPKLGSDAEMIAVKERDPFFDARLGVTLHSGDARFAGRNTRRRVGYPRTGAMRRFCTAAEARLRDLGVEILTGQRVTGLDARDDAVRVETAQGATAARRLFWTLPDDGLMRLIGAEIDLRSVAQPVGSAFFAYEVPADAVAAIDYVHDFSPTRRAYRYNGAGLYSGQVRADGTTFVMAEVPGHPAGLAGILTEAVAAEIWGDMQDLGFVRAGTQMRAHDRWSYPVAYTLPRLGWQPVLEAASTRIRAASPRLSTIQFGHRGRDTFIQFYETHLQHELRA